MRRRREGGARPSRNLRRRSRSKLLRVGDPVWRNDVAFRVGFPVLGSVLAVALVWLISQL